MEHATHAYPNPQKKKKSFSQQKPLPTTPTNNRAFFFPLKHLHEKTKQSPQRVQHS